MLHDVLSSPAPTLLAVFLIAFVAGFGWALGSWIVARLTAPRAARVA